MNYLKLISFFAFLLFVTSGQYAQSKRLYVKSSNTSEVRDGKTWQTAFSDLQIALLSSKSGDSIWIAQGTYYPTSGTDRNISFSIPNGVKVYGGFNGIETSLKERDWQANPTILSGDIGLKNQIDDNTYHVVLLTNTDSTATLNGLWIENGRANDGTSIRDENASGSGALIISKDINKKNNPLIENCVFRNNMARFGGAISIYADLTMGNLKLNNCKFFNNIASVYGGAIYWIAADLDGHIFLDNCSFEYNVSNNGGAIIHSILHGNLSMRNSTFEANESQAGGGILIAGNVFLDGCTFKNSRGVSLPVIGISTPNKPKPANTKVEINRTSFISNSAGFYGGVMGINAQRDETVEVLIQQTEFKDNRNTLGAQVLNLVNGRGDCKIFFKIDRCTFERNYTLRSELWNDSDTTYGTINIINYAKPTGSITGTISNSTFFKNNRPINVQQDSLAPTKLSILNSTFVGNNSGSILIREIHPSKQAQVYLQNNIFYDAATELSSILQSPLRSSLAGFHFNHNLFSAPSCKTSSDTLGCGIGNIFGQYPNFVDSSSVTGLKLAPGSLAINAGAWHPELSTLDLAGQARVQDCKVDLGTYESPSVLAPEDSLSAQAQIRSTPFNQTLGQISIQQIKGGFPPYRLLWESGDTTRTRSNLAAGIYTLTLIDQQGCFKNYSFVVPFTTSLNDNVAQKQIRLVPNPVAVGEKFRLQYQDFEPGTWQMQLRDLTGKVLQHQAIDLLPNGELVLHAGMLSKGIYFLTLVNGSNLFSQKLVVH